MIEATETINLIDMGQRARAASIELARLTTAEKNAALLAIADALEANRDAIIAVNKLDTDDARADGTDPIYIRDRLDLERRMDGMIADVRKVAHLPDPVGQVFDEAVLDNGLRVHKRADSAGRAGRDLRGAAPGDGGCRHAGPENGQRRHPARRA